jgi:hypothetical protein
MRASAKLPVPGEHVASERLLSVAAEAAGGDASGWMRSVVAQDADCSSSQRSRLAGPAITVAFVRKGLLAGGSVAAAFLAERERGPALAAPLRFVLSDRVELDCRFTLGRGTFMARLVTAGTPS